MRVLAAPHIDDPRDDGFVCTVPGELLYRPFVCDTGHEGGCGCARSMAGVSTAKGTTLVAVAELNITEAEYVDTIASFLVDTWGWERRDAETEARTLAGIAADYDAGTHITIRLEDDSHVFDEIEV